MAWHLQGRTGLASLRAPRRETGPSLSPFLCLGGFSSFLCLFVSGFHFKVYNKCLGVASPPSHFSLASPVQGERAQRARVISREEGPTLRGQKEQRVLYGWPK